MLSPLLFKRHQVFQGFILCNSGIDPFQISYQLQPEFAAPILD